MRPPDQMDRMLWGLKSRRLAKEREKLRPMLLASIIQPKPEPVSLPLRRLASKTGRR
jgi:hypothetical protein